MNERAVFPERGIQRGERVPRQSRQAVQMRRNPFGMGEQRLTEVGNHRLIGYLSQLGQPRRVVAVHEHQPVRRQAQRRQRPGIHRSEGGSL